MSISRGLIDLVAIIDDGIVMLKKRGTMQTLTVDRKFWEKVKGLSLPELLEI
jgi:hypothetical protein